MTRKQALPVRPAASDVDYDFEHLGISERDESAICDEERFKDCANLQEGISGCKPIDTTYENFAEDVVDNPRSDHGFEGEATHRRPAPHDVKRHRFPHRY